jgi:DNA-binding IclR family transcriptional regulator
VGACRRYGLVFSARLFVTLLHLRHNVPFRALGALVGMSKNTAHRAVVELVAL